MRGLVIIAVSAVLLSLPLGAAADRRDETRARIEDLAAGLADTANTYGPDALTVQVLLLMEAMKAGASGPTEVEVVGPSPRLGEAYLRIRVETGLIFDRREASSAQFDRRVWQQVAVPLLDRLETANFEPAGLELLLLYGLQDPTTTALGRIDPAEPSAEQSVSVVLSAQALRALLAGETMAAELFTDTD